MGKKMTEEKTWEIWTLSKGDIDEVCKQKNMSCKNLDLDLVARNFKKSVQFSLENWQEMLGEAIERSKK